MTSRNGWSWRASGLIMLVLLMACIRAPAGQEEAARVALGDGPGWVPLRAEDFVNVNCAEDTWKWEGQLIKCTGQPVGVTRSVKTYTNFELIVEWRHLKHAGNSGIFVWSPRESLDPLQPGQLPHGIEVQVLDPGYEEQYEKETGKKGDWFTGHGDVFPVGKSRLKPFPPTSPDGSRSFPRKRLIRPAGQWNHYYVRAINGEVRLWVNGEEVSGGNGAEPRTGHLALESEGSPIEFRGLRIRELP